jgi:hypothetical protein
MIRWWSYKRLCCCGHTRQPHLHYRGMYSKLRLQCSLCDKGVCDRFQWRLLKWVY